MLTELEKNRYWLLVDRCLTAFHDYSPEQSLKSVVYLRNSLERRVGDSEAAEIIYHEEPFEVACLITGNELNCFDYLEQYKEFVEEVNSLGNIHRIEILPEYTQSELEQLFGQVYESYCQNEERIGDVGLSPEIDRTLYDRVLASVVQLGVESETKAPFYYSQSPLEAAIFLMENQYRIGLIDKKDFSDRAIGDIVKEPVFKLVFRAQSNDRLDFQPNLWSVSDEQRFQNSLVLAAFCFLFKSVTEHNVPSLSLQALLAQAIACEVGIPTELLDWTSNPAEAILEAITGKEEDEQATVFFCYFEDLDNVLLPPPFSSSLFQKRKFFTAMNSGRNSQVFCRSCRITFPANKSFTIPRLRPLFDNDAVKYLKRLPLDIVTLAQEIAIPLEKELYALNSNDPDLLSLAIAKLLERLSDPINNLVQRYGFSEDSWNMLARVWILEIHRYLNDLVYFDSSGGKGFVATESLEKLVDLNRDALYLYANFMLSGKGEIFEEKRKYFTDLRVWLIRQHPELAIRDLKFLPLKQTKWIENVGFAEYLRRVQPELEFHEVAPSYRVSEAPEDFALASSVLQ